MCHYMRQSDQPGGRNNATLVGARFSVLYKLLLLTSSISKT